MTATAGTIPTSAADAAPGGTDRRADDRAWLAIAAIAIGGVLLRLFVLGQPGFVTDVGTFEAWAIKLAETGPAGFYEPGYFSDYPPAYLYVLWLIGSFVHGDLLRLAVKATSIPADIAIAVLLARIVWRSAGREAAVFAAALWLLAPGPIVAGPLWGQVDAVGTLPMLLALLAAGRGRWVTAGALGALAALVKPQFGLGLLVVLAGAAIELVRERRWMPLANAALAALASTLLLGLPFRTGPLQLLQLVSDASGTYPYTSLYAFNPWSILFDFWKPDDGLVVFGGALLVVGVAASCAPLWSRRDTVNFLAAGALATMAFYFLPTRAHERYLFPALALTLPFAATRARLLAPHVTLGVLFAFTAYFVLTVYGLEHPTWLDETLFSRAAQVAIALAMSAAGALIAWRLWRGEMTLAPSLTMTASPKTPPAPVAARSPWRLPDGLRPGSAPTRRDVALALLVAVAVLATRGYRLDWPRDMYFDEVYHARTAFELLAQREPYEWTHPHFAKEIMALGIVAFGDDRVTSNEAVPSGAVVAFAVANDGARAYGMRDGRLLVRERGGGGEREIVKLDAAPRAIALDGDRLFAVTDRELIQVTLETPPVVARVFLAAPPTSFAVSAGRPVVGMGGGALVYPTIDGPAVRANVQVRALAVKPDGSELYVLDDVGAVHIVDPKSGSVTKSYDGAPGLALAYAQGPQKVFVARADGTTLDVIDLEGGHRDNVPLANGRSGDLHGPATALAVVPRTNFLYALVGDRIVVAETYGVSPYAAIQLEPLGGWRFLGVDGEGDGLVAVGTNGRASVIETGRHGLAWRLPGVLFGAIQAFFLVLLARRLFRSPLVAVVLGFALLLDGSMFAQARIGMNDIYVGTFIVAGWYFVVAAHQSIAPLARATRSLAGIPLPRRSATVDLLIAGVLFGLGAASKWAAIYALAGMLLLALVETGRGLWLGRAGSGGPMDLLARRWTNALVLFACFAIVPVLVYLDGYGSYFGGPMAPYGWDLVELTKQMYWYHSSLTAPHPAGSPWWSWPFVLKPVYWYYGQSADGSSAVIYDAGNLVLFWGAFAATIWCAITAIRTRSAALGVVVFAFLAQYVAWIPITRVLFFYHFFTALPFYLTALACGLVAFRERGHQRAVIGFLAAAAGFVVFFYPFVSGQPVASGQSNVFYVLPTWQYDCQFYPSFTCGVGALTGVDWVGTGTRLAAALGAALLAGATANAIARRRTAG